MFGAKWKRLAQQKEQNYDNLLKAVRARSQAIKKAIYEIEEPQKNISRSATQYSYVVKELELLRLWEHADKLYWGE